MSVIQREPAKRITTLAIQNGVRVVSLTRGQRFRCIGGHEWTLQGRHGSHYGVYRVTGCDGQEDSFAGCAVVEPLDTEGSLL